MNLTDEKIKLLKKLPTGNIADSNTIKGVMDTQIKPINPHVHMVGRAVTVKCQPGDNLALHQGIYAAQAGDVLIFDCNGYNEAGHFGDVMTTACKIRGLAGVVINGSCRDWNDIYNSEFPVFARGVNPSGTVKETLATINEPVVVGGVTVYPGDIVVGDCDGVVVIPQADAELVFEKSIEKFKKEEKIKKDLYAGESTLKIFGFDKKIEQKSSKK